MKKPMNASTQLRLSILITALALLSACGGSVSEEIVGQRTLASRQACANALADGDIVSAQVACLTALEQLDAGFNE
jgi:hypothetical protein